MAKSKKYKPFSSEFIKLLFATIFLFVCILFPLLVFNFIKIPDRYINNSLFKEKKSDVKTNVTNNSNELVKKIDEQRLAQIELDKQTPKIEINYYSVGQKVKTADAEITVLSAIRNTKFGYCEAKNGTFVKLIISIKNISRSSIEIPKRYYLYDSKERRYDPTDRISCYNNYPYNKDLNPRLSDTYEILYEVPKEINRYHITVLDTFYNTKTINIKF